VLNVILFLPFERLNLFFIKLPLKIGLYPDPVSKKQKSYLFFNIFNVLLFA